MTVQLRRYEVGTADLEEFAAWWRQHLVPARRDAGFQIDFACVAPSTGEFIWAVSVDGDEDDFAAAERTYLASEARKSAVNLLPSPVADRHVVTILPISHADLGEDRAAPLPGVVG